MEIFDSILRFKHSIHTDIKTLKMLNRKLPQAKEDEKLMYQIGLSHFHDNIKTRINLFIFGQPKPSMMTHYANQTKNKEMRSHHRSDETQIEF